MTHLVSSLQRMPLPRSVVPRPGESFVSYLDRQALHHDVPLITMLHRLGITAEERADAIPAGYGVHLAPESLSAFGHASHLTNDQARSLLLEGFHDVCLDFTDLNTGSTTRVREIALREWAYFSGSHLCPACLAEDDGAWQVAWKLPWSFVCLRHEVVLASHCGDCGLRFASGRRDRQLTPLYINRIPEPARCNNQSRSPQGQGHRSGPCLADLAAVSVHPVNPDSVLLEAQSSINTVLRDGDGTIAGQQVTSMAYFQALRGLVTLLLHSAQPETVLDVIGPDLPDPVMQRLGEWFSEREQRYSERTREIAAGRAKRRGPRVKVAAGVPTDPLLLAALVTGAWAYVSEPSLERMARSMRPLLTKAQERTRPGQTFMRRLNLPEVISQAYAIEFDNTRFRHRLGSARATGDLEAAAYDYEPRHVPQLLWEDVYRERFERFFVDLPVRPESARRVLSIMLVELVANVSHAQAAELLELPSKQSVGLINKVMHLVRKLPNEREFAQELHATAAALSEQESKVDYAERRGLYRSRRQRFADLHAIHPVDWATISAVVGFNPGQQGGRDVFAAAWVWCRLAEGDAREAPALRARKGIVNSTRELYRKFRRDAPDDLFRVLSAYAEYLGDGGEPGRFSGARNTGAGSGVNGVVRFEFEPRHVPQLFWQAEYEERFKRFFEPLSVADRTGRASVSVALLELVLSMPRVQVGHLIGLDERFVLGGVSAAIQRVSGGADCEELQNALVTFGLELSEDPCKVDFIERGAALAGFTDISGGAWAEMCRGAGVGKGRAGVRSKHAAAWLWSYLMQADPRTSPAFRDLQRASEHATDVYQKFVRDFIPSLSTELTAYGTQVIVVDDINGRPH